MQNVVDRAFLDFILQIGKGAVDDYLDHNGGDAGSLIGNFISRFKMAANNTENVDEVFRFFGIDDDLCRKKSVCELYQILSSSNDYRSRFALWLIDRHVSGLSSLVGQDLDRKCIGRQDQRFSLDCDKTYREARCPISVRKLIGALDW
ncbi:Uncharacterised protein g1534 [Pycnogonum litorale]